MIFLELPLDKFDVKYQPRMTWENWIQILQHDAMSPCSLLFLFSWEISVLLTLQNHKTNVQLLVRDLGLTLGRPS